VVAGKIVVLVVEDEPLQRMLAMTIVEDAGFEALGAETADRAVRILEMRSDIRIVFTDVDMPGSMDGMKLAAAIRGRWPPIEIIITSGLYRIRDSELPPRSVFIQSRMTPLTSWRRCNEWRPSRETARLIWPGPRPRFRKRCRAFAQLS
jgi:CheY-like chemotaxis protein